MTYDPELLLAIKKYKSRCGFVSDSLILKKHIEQMNIPVTEFIKKIIVNMERCRWVTPGVLDAKEYIVVNIHRIN